MDFSAYLQFLINEYDVKQRDCYTLTDLYLEYWQEKSSSSNEPLADQELPNHSRKEQKREQQAEPLEVLAGLRQFVQKGHVLLVGKPGQGKSTALKRLRWELAEAVLLDEQQLIPVLVTLGNDYSILEAIKIELLKGNVELEEKEIKQLLQRRKFFLLLDSLNETRSKQREYEIRQFRKDNPHTPMVFTSRGLGTKLEIEQKLAMCKLTQQQIQSFVEKYLPDHSEMFLRQLKDHLRELAETPLLLRLLCKVFDPETQQFPQSQGELLRMLDDQFNNWKQCEGVKATEKFWQWNSELLRGLAFGMLQADGTPARKGLQVTHDQAEHLLEQFLQGRVAAPGEKAKDWLQDLLEHHLLQIAANPNEIEFHHQLFQEYYAAEYLLRQLPKLSDDQLKRNYLNLLKWTEPLAVMMSLSNAKEVLLIVKLAREVDWILGMRLAGKVKPEFQSQAIGVMNDLDLPEWLKAKFWRTTQPTVVDVPALLRAMEHKNSSVRVTAARSLGEVKTESAIQVLLQVLADNEENEPVREAAALALGEIGTEVAIPTLLKTALRVNDRSSLRKATVSALGKIGTEAAISALCEVTKHDQEKYEDDFFEWYVPFYAWERLREIRTETAIPALLKALEDGDPHLRETAAFALGEIGSEAAIPTLLKLVREDYSVSVGSGKHLTNSDDLMLALVKISVEVAIPILIQAIETKNHKNPDTAEIRTLILGNIRNEAAIPALLQALEHKNPDIREAAATSLGKIGSEAATSALLQALEDDSFSVREAVVVALGKIASDVAVPALLQTVERDSKHLYKAVVSLGKIGSEAAIPALLQALEHKKPGVREAAVESLGKIGSEAAIPALLQALGDDDSSSVRKAVVVALGEIGSEVAISSLLQILEGGGRDIGGLDEAVVVALGKIGSEATVPALLQALVDRRNFRFGRNDIPRYAVRALGEIGSEAAIPSLLKVLEDEDGEFFISDKAAEALENISKKHTEALVLHIPHLINLVPTKSGTGAFQVLTAIQSKCQFYSWTIQNENLILQNEKDSQRTPEVWIQTLTQEVKKMSSQPKNHFSGVSFNAPVNFGDNPTGDFIGTQNHYASDPEVQSTINDLKILISNLQAQYPTLTNETHALAIIDAEFTEIKQDKTNKLATLRKQLLNPERHLQATKATLAEVSKHYLEESVWAKAAITYLDKLSEEPNHGV